MTKSRLWGVAEGVKALGGSVIAGWKKRGRARSRGEDGEAVHHEALRTVEGVEGKRVRVLGLW
jgi:hypothetical protein